MNAAGRRRLTPMLLALALLLGALFLLLLAGIGRGVYWAPPRPPAPLPAWHPAALPVPVPLEQFAQVWQQPLFSPDRKPVAQAGSGGGQLGDMQLTGIILTPALHMALLQDKQGNGTKEVRVREGATLPDGSWTLVELQPRAAVFESSSGRTELRLPAGAPITAAAGSAPAPGSSAQIPNELPAGSESARPPLDPLNMKKGDGNPNGNPADGGGDGNPSGGRKLSALRGAASTEAQQAQRIRQLRAAILQRRAAQAAAAAHEGDR